MTYTTLNKINNKIVYEEAFTKLLVYLGRSQPDNEPLDLMTILEVTNVKYAALCLVAVDGMDREKRLFAADCAETVLHLYEAKYPDDQLPRTAIQEARDSIDGIVDSIYCYATFLSAYSALSNLHNDIGAAAAALCSCVDLAQCIGKEWLACKIYFKLNDIVKAENFEPIDKKANSDAEELKIIFIKYFKKVNQ